jgi:hypothetical protein
MSSCECGVAGGDKQMTRDKTHVDKLQLSFRAV